MREPRRRAAGLALTLALCAWGGGAGAQDEPRTMEHLRSLAGGSHRVLSESLETASRRLDGFFGGERVYEEGTGSSLAAGTGFVWGEEGEFDFRSRVRLHLVLPETRKRFKLLLENDVEEPIADEGEDVTRQVLDAQTRSSNYSTALRFAVAEVRAWTFSLDAGVKFEWPPDPFLRSRVRRRIPLGEWQLRAVETLRLSSVHGLSETTAADLERPLGVSTLVRSTSEASWERATPGLELEQAFAVLQTFDGGHGLAYRAGAYASTRPGFRVTRYVVSLRDRLRIYDKWLFFEVEPAVTYPEELRYKATWSLGVRLEALFGEDYL